MLLGNSSRRNFLVLCFGTRWYFSVLFGTFIKCVFVCSFVFLFAPFCCRYFSVLVGTLTHAMTRPKSYIVIFPKQQNMVHFSNSYKNINGLVNLKVMRIITLVYVGVGVAFPLLVRFIHFKNLRLFNLKIVHFCFGWMLAK